MCRGELKVAAFLLCGLDFMVSHLERTWGVLLCRVRTPSAILTQVGRMASTRVWNSIPFEGSRMSKSTGPRTPRGKARASKNSAKHWIASGRILPSELKDAEFLRHGFLDDFNPEGLAENELIDDIVLNRLIRRRTDMAFTREFSKASAEKPLIWLEDPEGRAVQCVLRSRFSGGGHFDTLGARLRPDQCIAALEVLSGRIKERGPHPEKDLWALVRIYGGKPTAQAAVLLDGLAKIVEGHPPETKDQEELKKWLLDGIQKEVDSQKQRLKFTTKLDAIEFASDIQEPATPTLENLLRYRRANTRELKDLLESYGRIHRLRRRPA